MVDDKEVKKSGESPNDAEQGQLTDKQLDKAAGGSLVEYTDTLPTIIAGVLGKILG